MTKLISYKNRKIDKNKPVKVYRCLNRTGKQFSIKQGNLVIAHAETIYLKMASFIVEDSGKQRCITSGERNVHAYIKGFLCDPSEIISLLQKPKEISYEPMRDRGFFYTRKPDLKDVVRSDYILIKEGRVLGYERDKRKDKVGFYRSLITEVGSVALCAHLLQEEKNENYEECQIIFDAITQFNTDTGSNLPTTWDEAKKSIEDQMKNSDPTILNLTSVISGGLMVIQERLNEFNNEEKWL